MDTQEGYNNWAQTYDAVINKTRDLEAAAIRQVLGNNTFKRTLEIGCGTGKNTQWLGDRSNNLTAVDFSTKMLHAARAKITSQGIDFVQADITLDWAFGKMDLVTCSLVLEHIKHIGFVFSQAAATLNSGGQFYIAELHPYKQLQGSVAKFEKEGILQQLESFVHHVSDYLSLAKASGFCCSDLQEWFDDNDRSKTPRLISFLFTKT